MFDFINIVSIYCFAIVALLSFSAYLIGGMTVHCWDDKLKRNRGLFLVVLIVVNIVLVIAVGVNPSLVGGAS